MLPFDQRPIAALWQYVSPAEIADTADDEVVAASSGNRHYVTSLQICNTDTAVGTVVVVKSASTVIWAGMVGPYVAAAPGSSYSQAVFPIPLRGAVGEALNVACLTNSAQVTFNAQGYTGK
jgi:hypothetical protein